MFTGDFLSDGGSLSSLLPTAQLGDFLQSSNNKVLKKNQDMQAIVFRGAHASPANTIPENARQHLQTL